MPSPLFLLLSGLLLASPSGAQRRRQPPAPKKAIDSVPVQENFDPNQFSGKWFLVAVASRCQYLAENHYRLEATNVVVTAPDAASLERPLVFSTFRPLDGHCWNITQSYFPTKIRGRFHVRGRGLPVDVAVGETDYSSYAILFFQKGQKISAKLYGRNIKVGDAITAKYEQRVAALGLDDNFIFYFPVYGFCHTADSFHILDETKYTGIL